MNYSSTEDDDDGIMHCYNVDRKGEEEEEERWERARTTSELVCSRDLNTNLKEESVNKTRHSASGRGRETSGDDCLKSLERPECHRKAKSNKTFTGSRHHMAYEDRRMKFPWQKFSSHATSFHQKSTGNN